jgi:ABC-2 type transport system ATP-binding protein
MTMTAPLTFDDVAFAYEPKRPVLVDFELAVEPGTVTLLAAPNGSGKSTAMWLAAGLLRPDRGNVRVFGRDPYRERDVLGRIGFLAEGSPMPDAWTGRDVLRFQRETFPCWDEVEVERLVSTFRLDLAAKVKALSRGQRGKLGLVTVLATRPEALLLDEPTLGLDLVARRQLLSEILGKVAESGCSIVIAGHEIGEAEAIADRFVLVSEGRVLCNEAVPDLLARHRVLDWDEPAPPPPEKLDIILLPSAFGHRALAHSWNEELAALWLTRGGRAAPANLETVYLSLTGALEHA